MNQINVIYPRWDGTTWVFTDEAKGLQNEPFVAGIPQMINTYLSMTSGVRIKEITDRIPKLKESYFLSRGIPQLCTKGRTLWEGLSTRRSSKGHVL